MSIADKPPLDRLSYHLNELRKESWHLGEALKALDELLKERRDAGPHSQDHSMPPDDA